MRDGQVAPLDAVGLELPFQVFPGFFRPREDHHAGGVLVQSGDDTQRRQVAQPGRPVAPL